MHSNRYFPNKFSDFTRESSINLINDNDGRLNESFRNYLQTNIKRLISNWNMYGNNRNDYSIYTGLSGSALLLSKISKTEEFKKLYELKDLELIEYCLKNIQRISVPTFLCGEIGPLTTAIIIYQHYGRDYSRLLNQILSIHSSVCSIRNSDLPDEFLYGRCGYLYSLLLLRSLISNVKTVITDSMIRQIIDAIIESGKQTTKKLKSNWPLTYVWYNESYVGAAHGYMGILYLLLECHDYLTREELENLIRPTIDMIMQKQFPSGNYPACLNENSDKLVHWCHGSPGSIYLMMKAYKIFNDDRYLLAAIKSCDNIWQRGLLRKGYGLCHGVAGNAYAFLYFYQMTNDPKYLYRACKFAEWCCHYGEHGARIPDTPDSLFEGLAGTIYFLIDLFDNPAKAKFPGFQL